MFPPKVRSIRASARSLLAVLALFLLSPAPARSAVVLSPWGGNIVLVGTQSDAGSHEDIETQSAPGFSWGTTLTSGADDNALNQHAGAYMTIGINFTSSSFGCSSVGQGSTNNSGATNKGSVLGYVQFQVTQTQQFHSDTQLIPGDFGSSLVFISNLMSDKLAVASLLGGPGDYVVDGRLSPGFYIYYYSNGYHTQATSGTCNTVISGISFSDVPNPLIQQHPQSQTVSTGSTTTFNVGASGSPGEGAVRPATAALTYQWRRNYQNLVNGGRVTGATTNHLAIASTVVADSGIYDCVVTSGTIVEPSSAARLTVQGTTAVDPADVAGLSLAPLVPSPFIARTLVRFALPSAAAVALDVVDVTGRRVRTLAAGARFGAGAHELVWDGATDRGDRAPAGVYFVRLQVGAQQRTRRVVRLEP